MLRYNLIFKLFYKTGSGLWKTPGHKLQILTYQNIQFRYIIVKINYSCDWLILSSFFYQFWVSSLNVHFKNHLNTPKSLELPAAQSDKPPNGLKWFIWQGRPTVKALNKGGHFLHIRSIVQCLAWEEGNSLRTTHS